MSFGDQAPPPSGQQGYPPAGQQGYSQGYSPAPGYPPPPPGYPSTPPQGEPQRTSGLAIAGFILAFFMPFVGFILSLIAVFKTGAGKAKGRGLAIGGIIISLLLMVGGVVAIFALLNSTVADPGCVKGKDAIINSPQNVTPASMQATIDKLNTAAAEAKHDDVRAAIKAVADDYTQLEKAMKTGNIPAGLEDKLNKDAAQIDKLCSV